VIEPPTSSREPRRTPTHAFRLLDETTAEQPKAKPKPRRRRRLPWGRWLRRVALLLVIAGVGAGGYWYYVLRTPRPPPPWAGLVDRVKKLVARSPAPPPSRRPTRAPPPAPPAATSPERTAPPPPAPIPQPVAPPSPFARFDRLSDSLARAVRSYRDRAELFASGRLDCGGLANGLVAIENLWPTYNAERRARMATFDQRRALQDQGMYASVDSVESSFEQSACRRP
jgi:pimeloyl-ACP methyl ester carboxylesterase